MPQIAAHKGPVYMRLLRDQVPLVLDEIEGYRFELGKAKLLRDCADVLIISTGLLTMRALEVAQDLAADKIGVAAGTVHLHRGLVMHGTLTEPVFVPDASRWRWPFDAPVQCLG